MEPQRRGITKSVLGILSIVIVLAAAFVYYTSTPHPSGAQCFRTGGGYALYVRVADDKTNASIAGAKVDAISYTACPSGDTEWGTPIMSVTPNNGTVSLPVGPIDGYSIIVSYQGLGYQAGEVFIAPVEITTVTLSVPSGNVTVAHSAPFGA